MYNKIMNLCWWLDYARTIFDAIDKFDAATYVDFKTKFWNSKAFILMNIFRWLVLSPLAWLILTGWAFPVKKWIEYITHRVHISTIRKIGDILPEERWRQFMTEPHPNWLRLEFERADSNGWNKKMYACGIISASWRGPQTLHCSVSSTNEWLIPKK